MKSLLFAVACTIALGGCAIRFEVKPAEPDHPMYAGPMYGPPQGGPVLAPGRAVVPAQPGTGTTIEHKPTNPRAYRCYPDGKPAVPPDRGTGWCDPKE